MADPMLQVRLARWGSAIGYGLLLAALALSTLVWPSRGREPNVVIWLLLTVPLLIFLPGLVRGAIRTHSWLSFVTLLYFAMAVPNVFHPDGRELAVAEVVGSVILFVSAMLYVRWAARLARE